MITENRHNIKLNKRFLTKSSGSYDNISWKKDDVGFYSSKFKDRHQIDSIAVRFKGQKSSKTIPFVVFKKYFKNSKDIEIDPGKWKNANLGGTKVNIRKKINNKDQLSKSQIFSYIKNLKEQNMDLLSEKSNYVIKQGSDGKYSLYKNENGTLTFISKFSKKSSAEHQKLVKIGKAKQILVPNLKKKIERKGYSMSEEYNTINDEQEVVIDTSDENNVLKMVDRAIDNNIIDFNDLFSKEMVKRINEKLDERKIEIANNFAKGHNESVESE